MVSADSGFAAAKGADASFNGFETDLAAAEEQTPDQSRLSSSMKKSLKLLWAAIVVLALCVLGLLIGIIVLAVNNGDDDDKRSSLAAGSAPSSNLAAGDFPGSNTILSTSNKPPAGYVSRGALRTGSGAWVDKAPLPAAGVSDGAAVALGSSVYHIGGHAGGSGNLPTTRVFVYNALLDTFLTDGPEMPVPVARGAAATDGASTIYYVGGRTRAAGAPEEFAGTAASCMWSLDTAAPNATWTPLPCPSIQRSDHCAAWLDGRLYVLGGYDAAYNLLDSIEEYDPGSGAWRELGVRLPRGRGDLSCVVLGREILVVGGIDVENFATATPAEYFTDAVVAVDVAAGVLTARAPMPHRRGDLAVVAIGGDRLLAIGGETHYGERTTIATHQVSEYISSLDTWVARAPMADARFRMAAAAVPATDGTVAVVAIGGHHRCDAPPDFADPDDDGGCDEIASVEGFLDVAAPAVFVHEAGADASAADGDVLLSAAAIVPGFTALGALHTGSGYWVRKAALTTPRSDFQAVTVGDRIYLYGGANAADATVPRMDVYNPMLDLLMPGTAVADTNARVRYVMGAVNDRILIAGGLTDNSGDQLASILIYDTTTGNITAGAGMATARSDACGAVVAGKLYVVGGYDAGYANVLRSAEVYDPGADSWSASPDLPEPRVDCLAAELNGELVVVGGYYDPDGKDALTSYHSTVFAFNPQSGTWRNLAEVPSKRGDKGLVSLPGGRLLVMGGETHAEGERTQVATHDVHEYYASADAWVSKAPMPTARFRFAAAAHEGFVYAFGGHQTCDTGDPGSCAQDALSSIEAYFDEATAPLFLHSRD